MRMRTRKFVGAVALITLVILWSLVGMALAPHLLSGSKDPWSLPYFAVAGLSWLIFAMPLVRWMSRPDPER
ncbi:MAG: hypothetical protein QOD74_1032 [Variibacter sp.]|jgi:hypothetical protein|nr:hypothetical protein [Variibacter sp.]